MNAKDPFAFGIGSRKCLKSAYSYRYFGLYFHYFLNSPFKLVLVCNVILFCVFTFTAVGCVYLYIKI